MGEQQAGNVGAREGREPYVAPFEKHPLCANLPDTDLVINLIFKPSQCYIIAICAVHLRDQPARAGADVSFPDGCSKHRRWSDRDFLCVCYI